MGVRTVVIAILIACMTAGAQDCPKYQHMEHWPDRCGPSTCTSDGNWINSCDAVCTPPPPDHCVDDLHIVTEKEWQELQERLAEDEHFMAHEARQDDPATIINTPLTADMADHDTFGWRSSNTALELEPLFICMLSKDGRHFTGCTSSVKIYPEQPQQTAMIEDDDFIYIYGYPVSVCTATGQKDCLDVLCEGRNMVPGCPNYKEPKP